MFSPPPAENPGKRKTTGPYDSLYKRPEVALLSEQQWLYVQRRYHMSTRELQVAELVCRGFSNKEIAKNLKIRPGTVKTHLRNVYRRIHVKNKIALLLKLVDAGTKFSAKAVATTPVPVIDIKKPAKKPAATAEIHKKEK